MNYKFEKCLGDGKLEKITPSEESAAEILSNAEEFLRKTEEVLKC